jgi:hypothetical protein
MLSQSISAPHLGLSLCGRDDREFAVFCFAKLEDTQPSRGTSAVSGRRAAG